MKRSFLIFLAFLKRDFFIYFSQIKNYLINYSIIYPVLFSISYGYIIPNTLLTNAKDLSLGLFLTGNIAFIFLILCSTLNLSLLLDFAGNRYIDYQLTLLKPKFIIMQKIVFGALFSIFVSTPFFIVSKIILREEFDTTNISIEKLVTIIALGCFCSSGYSLASVCILKNPSRTGTWWRRVNNPMLLLGGSWVPWAAMFKTSNLLGYVALLNPMLYITEGIRGAIFGPKTYIPFEYCSLALALYSIIFIFLTYYFFRKKTDFVD